MVQETISAQRQGRKKVFIVLFDFSKTLIAKLAIAAAIRVAAITASYGGRFFAVGVCMFVSCLARLTMT